MIPGGLGVVKLARKDREFEEQTHMLQARPAPSTSPSPMSWAAWSSSAHLGQTAAQANWLLGENMLAPQHGKAIRSLKDPGNRKLTWYDDDQFKTMEQYVDGADVHDSSGIPNHAFYLAAKNKAASPGRKPGPIWYEAFAKLKPKASFLDAARADGAA